MTHIRTILVPIYILGLLAQSNWAQSGGLVPVVSKPVSRIVELPGEFLPFLSVSLHAKIPSYVDRVLVDRGSFVKQGQLLVELSAPEMMASRLPKLSPKCRRRRRIACKPKRSLRRRRARTIA